MVNFVCPVRFMRAYLRVRENPISRFSPLFMSVDGTPLHRSAFITDLHSILHSLGLNDTKYCGHSFRIGAATTSVEDHLIKTLGRWSSSCYTRYIRTSPTVVQAAQQSLCYP